MLYSLGVGLCGILYACDLAKFLLCLGLKMIIKADLSAQE